jgi:small subunit ribosomal protein S5
MTDDTKSLASSPKSGAPGKPSGKPAGKSPGKSGTSQRSAGGPGGGNQRLSRGGKGSGSAPSGHGGGSQEGGGSHHDKGGFHKKRSGRKDSEGRSSRDREESFMEKLISVRRVTKVVKGGKNMRFSALVVVGDGKGRVGFATGKAREVPDAVKKAVDRAKKSLIHVPMRDGRTLHHDIRARTGAATVYLRSAPSGTGVIAGGAMRSIFEVLGLHDVVSKSIGTSNYHNTVRATFQALASLQSPRSVSLKLGKKVSDVLARRDLHAKLRGVKDTSADVQGVGESGVGE